MSTIDEEAPGPLPSETPATTTRRGRGKSRSSNIHGDLIMFAPTSVASSAVNQHMFHARHEPKQQQQSPELMGPILRRKKVVSMPIGAGGDFFSTIVETEPLVGGPHRQLAERGGDRTKSNSLGHEQGHTHRVRQETPTRRKKQSSFVNGLVRRKQISLDLLGPNDFFAIPQEEEVTEELLVPTKEEEEVVAAVAAGEEGELQEQQEEAKKPVKLFAPLRFQPRMVPKSRGGGHGSGGHGGHPAPASNHDLATIDEETKSAVRSYSMANQELRLQVMSLKKHIEEEAGESQELVHASQSAIEACNKSKEQEQAIKSKLLLGEVAETAIAEEQSVKDEDGDVCEEDMEEDDGNIIRATKRDKIRTGILFLLMLGITLVVALWKTHPEIELYLFVPVGLACVTYCPGNLETRDFFDNGHNHFITGDVIDIIMNIDANEEANGTGFLVQIYGEETHTVKATLEFPGPAPDERISEEQRLVVDFPDPEEHHIIIVNSTNPDLELSFTLLAQVKTPLAQYSVIIAAVIMIVVYLFILLEVIHRALVAIFGSMIALMFFFIMEGGYVETIPQIMLQLEWSTLGLLFGMMIIVGELSHTGVFEWCAVRLLVASNGSFSRLLVLLCTLTAVASAFLDNVTTMLLVAPVTIDMCNILEVDPRPYLISEVLLSNIGGTATLIGTLLTGWDDGLGLSCVVLLLTLSLSRYRRPSQHYHWKFVRRDRVCGLYHQRSANHLSRMYSCLALALHLDLSLLLDIVQDESSRHQRTQEDVPNIR